MLAEDFLIHLAAHQAQLAPLPYVIDRAAAEASSTSATTSGRWCRGVAGEKGAAQRLAIDRAFAARAGAQDGRHFHFARAFGQPFQNADGGV